MQMRLVKILVVLVAVALLGVAAASATFASVTSALPQMIKLEDYKPLLVTEVYSRDGQKLGEFARENRTLVPFEKIPERLIKAFVAAEDDTFFEHKGINYLAILRAFVVNVSSGEKKQGASTITQQVAKSLLLSSEKTYVRKLKEILLAQKMEENLSKKDILYLYLNQIYFGEGAWGIASAADTYFRKTVDKLTLPEMALLAGLPKAPSSYSPTINPVRAKERQKYVLGRMAAIKAISDDEAKKAGEEPITVYMGKEYKAVAPYFVETVRQLLVQQLGEKAVLDEGLRVYTSVDFKAQQEATRQVQEGLRVVDKRMGYRGPHKNIENKEEQEKFLLAAVKEIKSDRLPTRVIRADGTFDEIKEIGVYHKKDKAGHIVSNIPEYLNKGDVVEGIVTAIDDAKGLTTVRFAEGIGLIDVVDMAWARKPDSSVRSESAPRITKPSQALKVGDVIDVRVVGDKFTAARFAAPPPPPKKKGAPPPPKPPQFDDFAHLALEQKPLVEGALLSFDQKTGDVIAMVGGYEFVRNKNEFNRTIQAKRQTGSAFKTIVYSAALDRGYTPVTPIQDAPVIYESDDEGQEEGKTWKPHNHGQKFAGDILFRRALVQSLNIPAVKIIEDIGVSFATDYARRLGVFSPLNADVTQALGSSSLTLYEMTKVFSQLGRLGKRIHPVVVRKVVDKNGKTLLENLTLDERFKNELAAIDKDFEEKRKMQVAPAPRANAANAALGITSLAAGAPFEFEDAEQLVRPQTAYVMTTLLSAVVNEEGGTAQRARALGRPVAGKTGSTNGYFDGWFIGFTPQVATGVWVGFDEEKTLGPGEVGGRTALPIWLEYMKTVHAPLTPEEFPVPPGIVFANIDPLSGGLASASSTKVVRQAFIDGTVPRSVSGSTPSNEEDTDFLKNDLSQ